MSFISKISKAFGKKKEAAAFNPNINNNLNQIQNERLKQSNLLVRDPNYVIPADDNDDGVPDMLELKHRKDYGDGIENKGKLQPFSFKNPRKDYNQSFDKKGLYVPTATYPLPPVSWDKKMFKRNQKLRNKNNKFF